MSATMSSCVSLSASCGWALRRCWRVSSTTSASVSPRTTCPHSHVICLAMVGVEPIVGPAPFPYVASNVGAKLDSTAHTYVQLCGHLVVDLRGRRIEQRLPSRQGRAVFAFLVLQRRRAVGRNELIEAIWAGAPPKDHATALTVLLSKLRAAVGADVLVGRGSVRLNLPPD